MAEKSNLEIKGNIQRNVEETRSAARYDFTKNVPYEDGHEKTRTHEDREHPWGKGTGHGYVHTVPNYNLDQHTVIPQLDTEAGGGSYDIYGYPQNGDGGRIFNETINIYSKNKPYYDGGQCAIDTDLTDIEGQYYVTDYNS